MSLFGKPSFGRQMLRALPGALVLAAVELVAFGAEKGVEALFSRAPTPAPRKKAKAKAKKAKAKANKA